MRHVFTPTPPFSFAHTLAFARRFPPCHEYAITDTSLTAAIALDGKAVPVTITGDAIITDDPRAVDRALAFIGARDDLRPLYRAAVGDPPFLDVVHELHGLHHLRFLTLEDIAVYVVLMQRAPIAVASRLRARFLDAFGLRSGYLRAMPEMRDLVQLREADIARAIGHRAKAARIVEVVAGVAALGEHFLVTAPYERARDALTTIRGIGPFSAAAILLRGLGRMNELPWMPAFDDAGRAVYGARFSRAAIERRYGDHIGYWSFYVRAATGRTRPGPSPS